MLLAKIVIFILIQVTYLEQQPQPPLPLTDTLPLWCFLCNAVLLLAQLGESYTVCTGSLQTWHHSHTHFQQQPQPPLPLTDPLPIQWQRCSCCWRSSGDPTPAQSIQALR